MYIRLFSGVVVIVVVVVVVVVVFVVYFCLFVEAKSIYAKRNFTILPKRRIHF